MAEFVSLTMCAEIEPTAIYFGRPDKLAMFSFERKLNEATENLRFVSAALASTQDHIKMLQAFGEIVLEDKQSTPVAENEG
jgi:hypothetical protein